MTVAPAPRGARCYREPQTGPYAEKWFDADHPDGPAWFVRLTAEGRAKVAAILAEYPHPVAMLQRLWPSSYHRARTLNYSIEEIDAACMQAVVYGVTRWEPARGAAVSTVVGWALRAECARLIDERRYAERESFVSHLWGADPGVQNVGARWLDPAAPADAGPDPDAAEELAALAARAELTPRESEILSLRYTAGLQLHAVGARLGVSKERVRQIQHDALEKLRRAAGLLPAPPAVPADLSGSILAVLRSGPRGITALLDRLGGDRRAARAAAKAMAAAGTIHSWFAKLRGGRRVWRFGLTKPKPSRRKAVTA